MAEKSISALIGKKMTKPVKFMGQDVEINKLSVAEVLSIQEQSKAVGEDDTKGFDMLKLVIRSAVAGGKDLTDEQFEQFPMDELAQLSTAVMNFSGIGKESGK